MSYTRTNLDGSALTFPQDAKIHFEEEGHIYTVDGLGQMTPVSTIVSSFFKKFDADYWSLRKCDGDRQKAALLREQWNCKGHIAAQLGTHLHKQIENYLNTQAAPQLQCHLQYHGQYVQEQRVCDISHEWKMFMNFHHAATYQPFRTEWAVYDVEARMSGTIDLLCSRPDGTYEIFDWKRSNKINPTEHNRWDSGLKGLEHLTDTSYMHYCLQQNLYRYMLEKNYGLRVSAMHLVVLHPDYSNYRIVDVPRMEREVDIMLRNK